MRHAVRAVLIVAALVAAAQAEVVTRRWGAPPRAAAGKAQQQPPARPPIAYIPRCKSPPALDGRLDDTAWSAATTVRLSRTLDGTGPAAQPTEVRLLRDAKMLYVGVRCTEPLADRIRRQMRGQDADVWQDDSVEIFLGRDETYCHFGVSAGGATYDARLKDRGWDSGFRAAAAVGSGEWTAELIIPLDAVDAGEGRALIANFTRNRHAAGRWEESAWSPTFSGDSHVPARFGRLMLSEPPRDAPAPESQPAVSDSAVEVLPAAGGEGIVRITLAGLPPGATIYRADLFIYRTAAVTGASAEAMVEIEIYALADEPAAGETPKPAGRPLALRAPLFDRFDATEAVRAACRQAAAGPAGAQTPVRVAFFVKSCPLWNAQATCLEVAYEGEAKNLPPPATDVRAVHRAGQTFITWREGDPLVVSDRATWGEIRTALARAGAACRYRIYRCAKPIDAASLREAELIAEVPPLSVWNINARNKEYLIGQAMLQNDEMGELARDYNGYMHTWTVDSPRMDRFPVPRFVIDEKAGPLPPGTGLYVYNPPAAGRFHYAVVAVREGVENTRDVVSAAVDETVGTGEPVCQGDGLRGPYFDYPGVRRVYVQWCSPPLSPRPGMAFNWSVLTPPDVRGRAPAELYFHPEGYSYAQPGKKLLRDSIQIAPHDCPASGWYGYNDSWGTLRSWRNGVVRNHTQQRIVAFLDWAIRALPIDPDRILAVGADGAAALALNYPEHFAAVFVTGFDRQGVLEPKAADRFAAAWGVKSGDIADDKGRSQWAWANLDEMVRRDVDLPFFVCRGPSWGGDPGWGKGWGRFYRAMLKAGQPLVAHWAWGGQLQKPDWHTGLWRGVELRRNAPVPAFSNCSLDQEGEGFGNTNAGFAWKDVVDTPDSFEITVVSRECTFDMTPRRLQKFRTAPGERIRWQATPLPGRTSAKGPPQAQSGETAADSTGVVTIRGLAMPRECPGLRVAITRAR